MPCPRCHHATGEHDASCAGCGAPLLIGDEPAPARLDRMLDLDRRARGMQPILLEPGTAVPEQPPAADDPVAEEAYTLGPSAAIHAGDPAPAAASSTDSAPFAVSLSNRACEAHEGDRVPVGRRVAAAALDAALMASVAAGPVVLAARTLPAGRGFEALFPTCAAFVALLGFTYEVLGHALMGATVGKLLLGLRVTGPGGSAPGLARSAARAAIAVLGTAGLGIGMLVGLFSRSGRSLHDLVAGTSVVRAVPASPPGA